MSEPEYVTEMAMKALGYKHILLTWRPT